MDTVNPHGSSGPLAEFCQCSRCVCVCLWECVSVGVCVCVCGGVCDGDFLHLTLCLASYLPSYNPFQPHTCSLLVSHSTFFTLSPPRTPSLTCYLSADLLSPSHRALSPSPSVSLSHSLHAFSTRSQMQPSGQGEKMGKKKSTARYKAAFQGSD